MKKINQIFQSWKPNTVFTSNYLESNGFYRQLLNKYVHSNWLERIGKGAYIKKGDKIDLFGALNAIQEQLELPIYIGGKTALLIQGLGHYINDNIPYIELYSLNSSRLPNWFLEYNWETEIIYSTSNLFGKEIIGLERKDISSVSILISSPERAIFELLNNLNNRISFYETYKIFENLYNLRPELLNELLSKCESIKVKRLFLYFSEKSDHFWFEDLDLSRINLGSGKREIYKNGILDKKYLITVPKDLDNEI
ncbi:MAG: type IV toxin-antitoxin system AbiEi family antitoxin domain-containing protein [Candidatus Sericytochromatia bacterium]